MLTCLFLILFVFLTIKITKIRWIWIIEILLLLTKNNPNCHGTLHTPSNFSITSLSYFYPLRLSLPSIRSLHSLDYVMQEVQLLTGEYTSICNRQITTFVLARRYALANSSRIRRLTSYDVIYHFLPDCHPSLLWCGDFLLKCYCYLFYT